MARTLTCRDLVADVLANWPATARVFIDRQMGCVGCVMARFETVPEAVDAYGFVLEDFLRELTEAIDKGGVDDTAK